jgi:hypothetical protein
MNRITDEQIAKCTNLITLFIAADRAQALGDKVLKAKLEKRMKELKAN